MRLSVIVVAFGKEELLGECLSSLEAALERVDGETELIVVANDGPLAPAAVRAGRSRRSRAIRASASPAPSRSG